MNVAVCLVLCSLVSLDFVFVFLSGLGCIYVYIFGVSNGPFCVPGFYFVSVFSLLAKRLAAKSISEMVCFMLPLTRGT